MLHLMSMIWLQDYVDPTSYRPGFLKNVKVMFDMRDVVDDVQGEKRVWRQCIIRCL